MGKWALLFISGENVNWPSICKKLPKYNNFQLRNPTSRNLSQGDHGSSKKKLTVRLFIRVAYCCLVTKLFVTLCDPIDPMEPARLLCPWDFPGKNTGVGCHFLPQGIFPTQGLNSSLL